MCRCVCVYFGSIVSTHAATSGQNTGSRAPQISRYKVTRLMSTPTSYIRFHQKNCRFFRNFSNRPQTKKIGNRPKIRFPCFGGARTPVQLMHSAEADAMVRAPFATSQANPFHLLMTLLTIGDLRKTTPSKGTYVLTGRHGSVPLAPFVNNRLHNLPLNVRCKCEDATVIHVFMSVYAK